MATLEHEIVIAADPQAVHRALTTREGLGGWQSPGVSGDPGRWIMRYAGHPSFTWDVIADEAPVRVEWRCAEGPGSAPGTTVEYTLSPDPGRGTRLRLVHHGWPEDAATAARCNTLWGALLHHLKAFAESGSPAPAFD